MFRYKVLLNEQPALAQVMGQPREYFVSLLPVWGFLDCPSIERGCLGLIIGERDLYLVLQVTNRPRRLNIDREDGVSADYSTEYCDFWHSEEWMSSS